ncbi:GntR family transcriptional regulator [Rhizobium sp. SJZ105]|uniref:GntR family transcriptional regulator n=1 Tax=Rhizobium sp. SJZ105 TaxID=2572678 RepID=UPI0011A9AE28|nr:GntR family transcriptional regulator [Rhizobium sp. SJZ105]TWC76441.1 GntR family transcriptional regulator [Rhizobium sp. SJZ105]
MSRPPSGSLTEEAFNRIRNEILASRLPPGQKLVIADLCGSFGFSLGAVREALARLTAEGLVEAEPRKGFTVAPITEAEIKDITNVRNLIETLCLDNAIQHGDIKWEANIVAAQFELSRLPIQDPGDPARLSEEWAEAHKRFHEALVAACDSPWLLRIRNLLFNQSERYRRLSVPLDSKKRDLVSEHKEIADACLSRDSETACAALKRHLDRTTRIIIDSDVCNMRQSHNRKPKRAPQERVENASS